MSLERRVAKEIIKKVQNASVEDSPDDILKTISDILKDPKHQYENMSIPFKRRTDYVIAQVTQGKFIRFDEFKKDQEQKEAQKTEEKVESPK